MYERHLELEQMARLYYMLWFLVSPGRAGCSCRGTARMQGMVVVVG